MKKKKKKTYSFEQLRFKICLSNLDTKRPFKPHKTEKYIFFSK